MLRGAELQTLEPQLSWPLRQLNRPVGKRQQVRRNVEAKALAVLGLMTIDLLKQSYLSLEMNSSPGIDGKTWQAYGENLEEKLKELHDKVLSTPRSGDSIYSRRSRFACWRTIGMRSGAFLSATLIFRCAGV